jgi:hypothetical protein
MHHRQDELQECWHAIAVMLPLAAERDDLSGWCPSNKLDWACTWAAADSLANVSLPLPVWLLISILKGVVGLEGLAPEPFTEVQV